MDLTPSGRRYTWSNNQENSAIELLDRVLDYPSSEENSL
jgi:hypothetical protein